MFNIYWWGSRDRARSGTVGFPRSSVVRPRRLRPHRPRGDGARRYRSGSGDICADEGTHWDVTYYNCGGC